MRVVIVDSFVCLDTFTDTSISATRVNGDHREKVLQRWDGNGNGENFELEADAVRSQSLTYSHERKCNIEVAARDASLYYLSETIDLYISLFIQNH